MSNLASLTRFLVTAALAFPGTLAAQGELAVSDRAALTKARPGDKIYVHILREPLLSDTVTVDERGQAAFPKLGLVDVTTLPVRELNDSLRARYAQFLRTPELEIVVLRRVIVNGEVRSPNVYLVNVSSSVADVIARAGGLTDAAKRKTVHLVRDRERIAIRDWDKGAASNLELHSGDQIIVSRRSWFSLNALPAVSTAALLYSIIMSTR